MNKYFFFLFVLLVNNFVKAQQKATAKEYFKEYVTYPFSDPDPIPASPKLYPYFRFDGFTDKGSVKKWKVVELENEYIKVQVMPEIGGKVWTAYDKIHGKHFFYNNEVVKFRDIAMRGPWVSGGIEVNYGIIGHTPNSATPVDYLIKNNDDGSVSCFTSTLDLLTRTRWVLEIKLEKDKAYFSTTSYWFNSTGKEQPYYTWMNAGIPAGDDLQFLYPGNKYIGHDGSAHNWPLDDQGRNLSHYSENKFDDSKSYHVLGTHSNYFGALWKKDDFGMIHYSRRGDKLGKKIFLWAQSDEGKIWEDLLTDNSGQYVEIQSGRLFNQNVVSSSLTPFKQIGFFPYSGESWTEYWYPFGDLNGFTDANLVGAFNIHVNGQGLSVAMSPVQNIKDTLKVYNKEGKEILSKYITAKPLALFSDELKLPKGEDPSFIVLGGNRVDIMNKEDKNLSRPLEKPVDFDHESAYGLYLQGRDLYRFRNYQLAEEKIKASLYKDAHFLPALVEMAKLKLFRMQYDSAFYHAKKALSIDTYNAEANYYYGISASKISRDHDAMDGFDVAGLSPEFRNAAYSQLSRLYLKKNNLLKAEEYANLSLQNSPYNIDALQVLYVLARINNEETLLQETGDRIKALNPLNHFVRFERYYQDKTRENEEGFISLIRNEMPIESFLELSIWYSNVNRIEESIAVLEMAPKNAESLYWLAWLTKGTPQSKIFLEEAEKASVDFVFPFREETAEVLEWVSSKNSSWRANYLLALINDFKGNRTKALSLIQNDDKVDFAPFFVMKARVDEQANNQTRIEYLEKAVKLQPKQWRYGRILAQLLSQNGDNQKGIKVLEKYYNTDKTNYILGLDLIKLLMLGEDYEKAEKILSTLTILPFEGATDGRKYYRQTKLMLAYKAMETGRYAKALEKIKEVEEWPKHLGVGKPYPNLIDDRLENSMKVLIYKKMGSAELTKEHEVLLGNNLIKKESFVDEIKAISFKNDQRMF